MSRLQQHGRYGERLTVEHHSIGDSVILVLGRNGHHGTSIELSREQATALREFLA